MANPFAPRIKRIRWLQALAVAIPCALTLWIFERAVDNFEADVVWAEQQPVPSESPAPYGRRTVTTEPLVGGVEHRGIVSAGVVVANENGSLERRIAFNSSFARAVEKYGQEAVQRRAQWFASYATMEMRDAFYQQSDPFEWAMQIRRPA
jgi:hypothetical protein